MLLCYWAREEATRQQIIERDRALIQKQASKAVSFTVADDPKHLIEQLPDQDVLYVAGGDANLIEPFFKDLTYLGSLLEGKTYIGSSMGAFLAAKNYVLSPDSEDVHSVHQGVNLLPVNILCHWNVEPNKEAKLKLLNDVEPKLPTLTLAECQYAKLVF